MSDPPASNDTAETFARNPFVPPLSDLEIQLLARLAAMDLDGFLAVATGEWDSIQRKAGTAIAKAIILAGENIIPECKAELRSMLILAFRARALQGLIKHVAHDPQLRQMLQHDDAQIDRVLETCIRENLALKKQFDETEKRP